MTTATELKLDHCRSCHAPVYWVKHRTTGKPGIIDAAPAPGGNIKIDTDLLGEHLYWIVPSASRPDYAGQLHLSHFATCPDAAHYASK